MTIEELQGIGICMPSFILFDQGYVCMTSAMVNIRDFPMRDYLTQRLRVPIILDNATMWLHWQSTVLVPDRAVVI